MSLILAGCVSVLVGSLSWSAAALAAGPPTFNPAALSMEVHATRVAIEPMLNVEELVTTWRAEYAKSNEECKPPEKESGCVWVLAGGATDEQVNSPTRVMIGKAEGTAGNNVHYLRHLAPNTGFYARFVAANEDGKAIEIVPFTTLAPGKPEIAQIGGGIPPEFGSTFYGGAVSDTVAHFKAQLEGDGSEITEYSFGYSSSNNGPFTLCGAVRSVTLAEEFTNPAAEASCTGLKPETSYFARLRATNTNSETTEETIPFTTLAAKPYAAAPEARNVTATSAVVAAQVSPHGSETQWRLEYAASPIGPWSSFAAGTISQAQAEALEYGTAERPQGKLAGLLSASTEYYVRMVAENVCGEGCGSVTSSVTSFKTSGPPVASTFAVHALHGESLRLLGAVNPSSTPTQEEQTITVEGAPTGGTFTLTFKGQTTKEIAFNATSEAVRKALSNLPGGPEVVVSGPSGGPWTVWFEGANVQGSQPQIEASSSLTPSGSVTVATTQRGGEAYDTHYHFEYVSRKQFEAPGGEGGFAKAAPTPAVDVGSGNSSQVVDADLPALTPGESYRFRITATNTEPGNPVVYGEEHSLTAPVPAPVESVACSNEAFRTGASASLPDCRAYEQLTPVHKNGSQEPWAWGGLSDGTAEPAEDGERLLLNDPAVQWALGPRDGGSPYFFHREEGKGWTITATSSQPEFGVDTVDPQVFDPTLTHVGFESSYLANGSSSRLMTGVPGGAYATAASIPPKFGGEWVAASRDFSKLILTSPDHGLVEPKTTTKTGEDLYEYDYAGGGLRQVNVGVGTCGARIVHGNEQGADFHRSSSADSVSADGSRVFFEAVPGSECSSTARQLYARVNGTETIDFGPATFLAANEDGSEVLFEKNNGEIFLDDLNTKAETHLFTVQGSLHEFGAALHVAAGVHLTALYFVSNEQLTAEAPSLALGAAGNIYRYDIPGRELHFLLMTPTKSTGFLAIGSVSQDGRYAYFGNVLNGVPGGGIIKEGHEKGSPASQVYRYDSVENMVECVSCASPSDPEPDLISTQHTPDGAAFNNGGLPSYTAASANGDYAFFTTPAKLLPADVDGEFAPEGANVGETGHYNGEYVERGYTSTSSDIYEWRRDGLNGCSHLQGCLALISSGTGGGGPVLLLGSAHEGRDVFIYTGAQLLSQDKDTAGDIYDARIGGGFREPPPRPTECVGDTCAAPPLPPVDATPASLTFTGVGNVTAQLLTPSGHGKPCRKGSVRKHGRCVKRRHTGRAKHSNRRKGR
jgi:hypothetical protein